MRTAPFLAAIVTLALTGCATVKSSPVNPQNWFDKSSKAEAAATEIKPLVPERRVVQTVETRPLVSRVDDLTIRPVDGGILVTAVGTNDQSGSYGAELVTRSRANGVLVLELRAFAGKGTGGTRITSGTFVSNQDLAGITQIDVVSASNSLSRRSTR